MANSGSNASEDLCMLGSTYTECLMWAGRRQRCVGRARVCASLVSQRRIIFTRGYLYLNRLSDSPQNHIIMTCRWGFWTRSIHIRQITTEHHQTQIDYASEAIAHDRLKYDPAQTSSSSKLEMCRARHNSL